MRCLSSAKFTMMADILRQGSQGVLGLPSVIDPTTGGSYVEQQDPLTHEIVRKWVPAINVPDNINTPNVNESTLGSIPCEVKSIIEGGIRVAGSTERWGELYENVDYVRMRFSPKYFISKRDRITNIRNKKGVIWVDEETGLRPTEFEVLGVQPVTDAFGNHVENVAMLQKAEVYSE